MAKAKKTKKKEVSMFPRNVYKKGGNIKWSNGCFYSTEYVENEIEYKAALKSGFVDNFSEAIFGEETDEPVIEGDFEEEEKVVTKSMGSDFSDDDF